MKKSIVWFIIPAIMLLACEKDVLIKSPEIRMGDYTEMVINYYDTTLMADYNKSNYYNIDLDNNGVNDVQFESKVWGSSAAGVMPLSSIKALHSDVQFFGYNTSDTSFYYVTANPVSGQGSEVTVYEYLNYSCKRSTQNDSILGITPSFKLIPLASGDPLKTGDTFKSDTITLKTEGFIHPVANSTISGDTTTITKSYYHYNCFDFPGEQTKYIGVKLNSTSRLGWIKIAIFNKSKILIIESGIQK